MKTAKLMASAILWTPITPAENTKETLVHDATPAPATAKIGDIVAGDYRTAATYVLTYQRLQAFEADLHKHVHLENSILFPRASERFARAV